ncbi:MAG: fused MFS/spermidine synthase [Candidatus Altiarchaeota archaeon]|nr:fused MFS/spermidine synthase [Candidatus Altiarchaeota archaeon]
MLNKNNFFLLSTAFTTGACIMVLELAASRVLAPSFGGSIYVWGSLIGVIMVALAAGYYLGGWTADRSRGMGVLYKNLIFASVLVFFIYAVGDYVVRLCLAGGLIYGPIAATLILFTLPMTILAMTSPMVIKYSTEGMSELGISAGTVYAVSTAGSILGTFAGAFLLIPLAGTKMTLAVTGLTIMLTALSGLAVRKNSLVLLVLIPLLAYPQPIEKNVIYKTESEYNIIKVLDFPDYRTLKLNYDYATQSKMMKDGVLDGEYLDYVNLGPLLTRTDRILWLGASVGDSPKQLSFFYNATIDAVEIDPKVIEIGREYFNFTENDEIRIHAADGRMFLRKSGTYDVINVDTFSGGFDVPFHMATKEFFQEASDHMTDDGVLTMNVLAVKDDERVSDAVAYTMKQVFPSVYVVKINQNRLVLAFKKWKTIADINESLTAHDPRLDDVVKNTLSNIEEFKSDEGIILTDDKSRLDELTFDMMRKLYEI